MSTIVNELNSALVGHFSRLGGLYAKCGEKNRSGTFYRVATLVAGLKDHVDDKYDIKQHAGCGASTEVEIKEFLATGSSARLTELVMRPDMPLETLQDKIARLIVVRNPSLDGSRVSADLVLTAAINGLTDLDSYMANLPLFDQYMLDSGLEQLLAELKTNINL
jgi:hypothetical protein